MTTDLTVADTMTREKIELIKQTVAKGASDLELDLFLHACKRTGLDPLMKQIYAIKRWNGTERRETMSFQTGIDGYRLIADRTGRYAGSDEPTYMVGPEGFPDVASVTVYKMIDGQRCAFSASARWLEYVQKTKDGQPTSMWVKMPYLMLGKCAEALALRKAFPAELSGVYTHEEMMQADNDIRVPAPQESPRTTQLTALKKAIAQPEPQEIPKENGTPTPVAEPMPDLTMGSWADTLNALADDPDLNELLTLTKQASGLKTLAYSKLTAEQRRSFLGQLREMADANGLGERLALVGMR